MTRLWIGVALALATVGACAEEVPVTNIVLFSSGVGYFQRYGTVTDNAAVQLSFKPEQINDLLKSLVLLDLDGGTVGAVTYGAKDPLAKTLASFAINLNGNPSLAELLNRLRGVPVEVATAQMTLTGKILGVEVKKQVVREEIIAVETLNLLTDAGITSVRLEEIASLRILDERLNKELQDALAALAAGLDTQRKPVSIAFTGQGARRVIVGYIAETPVWKTSYRLVLGKERHLLQGWAIVENTSDADWHNVRISLISGRPISFIQDLYTPLYLPRPTVRPELYASLRPVNYDVDLDDDGSVNGEASTVVAPPGPGGPAGPAGRVDSGIGWDATHLQASIAPMATAGDLGEVFEYAVKDPVTLPRQQSAMLPIIASPLEAWRLSIYNATVHPEFPLYGLRLKNTTGNHLMGGPITVYNGDVYAGDATFKDLQPGEQRLISYAMDLAVHGERKELPALEEIVTITLVRGQLSVTRKYRRTVAYTFAVKDGEDRKLMVEHPFLNGWELVEPARPDERTDALYRFLLAVPAEKGATLTVVEERTQLQATGILSVDTPTLLTYLKTGKLSPAVEAALQRVVALQNELVELRRKQDVKRAEINTIRQEQQRIRENMGILERGSDLYKRYAKKLDEQETRIEQLLQEIDALQERITARRTELDNYVAGLTLA